MDRRQLLRGSLLAGGGAVAGIGGLKAAEAVRAQYPLPFYDGYAASIRAGRRTPPKHPMVPVVWSVDTAKKLIALTFDDGPMPQWTPEVLTILAEERARATFFLIGENAQKNGGIIAGAREHEYANHTWAHVDLARLDYDEAYEALNKAHDAITQATGREPAVFRPPYGHLGGSSLRAAAEFGYATILWNLQMLESDYKSNPPGLVDYIAESSTPGTILLAHDTGPDDRLVAIRGLAEMIRRLKAQGFEFVTVSELLAEHSPAPRP